MTITEVDQLINFEHKILELNQLLESECSRFSHYQTIPECVQEKLGTHLINYSPEQVELDKQRFAFLIECIANEHIENVAEFGANIGYFSINLAKKLACKVDVFEPMERYVAAINIMADLCEIEHKLTTYNEAICIDDLAGMNQYDLLLSLNVLHHAGHFFDQQLVNNIDDWYNYFVDYLNLLAQNSNYLFLQTGNMWEGQPLFASEHALTFIAQAIAETTWQVEKVGVILNFDDMHYHAYNADAITAISKIKCRRNELSNMVEYSIDGKIVANLKTGMAQRPLWFLKRRR